MKALLLFLLLLPGCAFAGAEALPEAAPVPVPVAASEAPPEPAWLDVSEAPPELAEAALLALAEWQAWGVDVAGYVRLVPVDPKDLKVSDGGKHWGWFQTSTKTIGVGWPYSGADLRTTLLHEIGHACGREHHQGPGVLEAVADARDLVRDVTAEDVAATEYLGY